MRKTIRAKVSFDDLFVYEGAVAVPAAVWVDVEVSNRASFETVKTTLISQAFAALGATAILSDINTGETSD